MPLGKTSLDRLATCHKDMQHLVTMIAKGVDEGDLAHVGIHDVTVLCGHRGEAEQNDAVARGASKTPWPRSAHNRMPSHAVDLVPYPIPSPWDEAYAKKVWALHCYGAGVAHAMGIDLKGISWDGPHFEGVGLP